MRLPEKVSKFCEVSFALRLKKHDFFKLYCPFLKLFEFGGTKLLYDLRFF